MTGTMANLVRMELFLGPLDRACAIIFMFSWTILKHDIFNIL